MPATNPCRAACNASPTYEVGTPDDLAGELEARGEDACCSRVTVRCATRSSSGKLERRRAGGSRRRARRALAALVELATRAVRARGVRAAGRGASAVPSPERRGDRRGSARGRVSGDRSAQTRTARRAHRADAAAARALRAARSRTRCTRGRGRMSLFLSELALRSTARVLRRQGRTRGRRLRGADDDARRRPRHDDRGRPGLAPPQIGTRLLLAARARSDRRGARPRSTLEVRMSNRGAQEMYRRFGFGRSASARTTTRRQRGRARHVGARGRLARVRRAARRASSAACRARPSSSDVAALA